MWGTLKRNLFPFLIGLSALSVSGSAAFYSVSGLSKLFAGASLQVIIMAGSLETAKLIITVILHRYWGTLNKALRVYLSIAVVTLVLITSMGIYGFLSAAYQETASGMTIVENRIEFLEQRADFYQEDVSRFDAELKTISDNIAVLSNSKSQQIQVRDTTSTTGFRNTISTAELRLAQERIKVEEANRANTQQKRQIAADSLQSIKQEILMLEAETESNSELGPLKYLSTLTGVSMDRIINWLILIIIFVFDPLAVSLVVASSFAFEKANQQNLYGEYKDNVERFVYDNTIEDEEDKDWDVTLQDGLEDEPVLPTHITYSIEPSLETPKNLDPEPEVVTGSLETLSNPTISEETNNDWTIVDEDEAEPLDYDPDTDEIDLPAGSNIPPEALKKHPKTREQIVRILQRSPQKVRILNKKGQEKWIDKTRPEVKEFEGKRYL